MLLCVFCEILGTGEEKEKKKAVGTSRGVRHTFLRASQILNFLNLTRYNVYSYVEFFKKKFVKKCIIMIHFPENCGFKAS